MKVFLHPIPKTPIPFHTIHIDHLGPYPKSPRKNLYLVVIVDGYTKFTLLKAVKNTSTRPIINAIKDFAEYIGLPACIVCDRESSFRSNNFEDFCLQNNIELHHVATAIHRANGQVEIFNRTINQMMAIMCNGDDGNWDKHIRNMQWALNSMQNSTTKETPQKLMFGFEPKPMTEDKISLELHNYDNLNDDQRKELSNRVVDRIQHSQEQQKERFDATRKKADEYEVGEFVMIKTEAPSTGQSRKLSAKYKGPYRVVQKLYGDRYVIEGDHTEGKRRYKGVQAAERMKRCSPPPDISDTEESSSNNSDCGQS